jgi:plastocyanin
MAASLVAVTLTGCSGDSTSTDVAGSAAATTASAMTEETPEDATEEGDESAAPDAEATGTAVLIDGEAPAERTITITADAMSPDTLTIAAGDTVTFTAGDDAVYAVEVGELESATVSGGLIETFQFPEAGQYEVVEIISGNSAVIVVE